ncbi:hypothetical protein, partial [Treponema phagedenis]|uniref:hypothetical protein n=1 Tax=Treponema phagedenis TaxID=162 RepID=UPI001C069F08
TSFKASYYKKSPTRRNGEQFTIVMLNPVSFKPNPRVLKLCKQFALKHRFCLEPRASVPILSFDVHVKN